MIGICPFNLNKKTYPLNARKTNRQPLTLKKNRNNPATQLRTKPNLNPFMRIVLFPTGKAVILTRCNSTMRTLILFHKDWDRVLPVPLKKYPVTLTHRQTCKVLMVNNNTVIK